jgi:hypothetical protein
MILPAALALGAALVLPVVDGVPNLKVEQVCDGIAKQGGVTFHDPSIEKEKKNCLARPSNRCATSWSNNGRTFPPRTKSLASTSRRWAGSRAIPSC